MEALSFFSLWRPITTITTRIPNDLEEEDEEEEESFFELELTVPDFDRRIYTTPTDSDTLCSKDAIDKTHNLAFDSSKPRQSKSNNFFKSTPSLSPGEFFSRRKILPIESCGRPHSPISLLKSAPRFRVFMFRKSRSMSTSKTQREEEAELGNRGSNSFTVKLKMKDLEPTLARGFSSRKSSSACSEDSFFAESNSKRFAKDVIQKYLKLVRPLYVKVSKRHSDKVKPAGELSASSSPAMVHGSREAYGNRETHGKPPLGFRVVPRQLGKSKSASAAAAGILSPARRDDSLVQQNDGIESAILHCKRSFNSSREFSPLSRSTSAHEKPFDSARHSIEQTSRISMS